MRVVIVVKQHSEFASEAEMWKRDFEYEARKEVELIDPETIDGEMFARARNIVQYPTVLVLQDDGMVIKKWTGRPLPQISEVKYVIREV